MSAAAVPVTPAASRVRWLLVAIGAIGAMVAVCGLAEARLFAHPTTLKYALTVAAPLVLVLAAAAPEPLFVFVPLIVVAAPFAGFTATFATRISVLAPLVAAGAIVAVISGGRPRGLSTTGWAVLPVLALLAVPFVDGVHHGRYVVLVGTMIVVGWLVSRAAALPRGLEVVLWSLLASAAVQAGIAIWEFHAGRELNLYSSAGTNVFGPDYFFSFGRENRPVGSLYDPISLGNILALACPAGLVLAIRAGSVLGRLLALAALLTVGVGLVLTLSRASWIGAAAGILVALLLVPADLRWRALITSGALAAVAIVLAIGTAHGSVAQRYDSIFHPTELTVRTRAGDLARTRLWRAALAEAREHPAAGVGLGNLPPRLSHRVGGIQSHAQSTYLELVGEAGILGALALALLLWSLFVDTAAGLRRERALYAALTGALASILVTWGTDYTVRYVPVAAALAVVFGAIASGGARRGSLA